MGASDLLEVMDQILDEQPGGGGQGAAGGLHEAVDEAIRRAAEGEDVDVANLVEQFSEVRRLQSDKSGH